MASNLLPFRDYSEHDVINLFTWSGAVPRTKGCVVRVVAGFDNTTGVARLGDVGANHGNTVSERYGVHAKVAAATGSAHSPLGMTLYDVKEEDENGEKLIFNPRKAAEMEIALSGQAVPVVTKGIFLYSGGSLGSVEAGSALYTDTAGELTTTDSGSMPIVGRALGAEDSNGHILVRINL